VADNTHQIAQRVAPESRILDFSQPVAIMHAIGDHEEPYEIVAQRTNRSSHQQFTPRSHAQVMRFFDGLDLLEPGVVRVGTWRPASGPPSEDTSAMWGA
jgi:hypothetical protein